MVRRQDGLEDGQVGQYININIRKYKFGAMPKTKSHGNTDVEQNEEIHLTKKQFYLALIFSIASVILSVSSIVISKEANFISQEANNISLTTLAHQQIIEESDLQIGTPQSANYYNKDTYLNESSIRIPIVNGYYARYPALILSIHGELNGKNIDLRDLPTLETNATENAKNYRFVERDEPTYIEVFFSKGSFNISDYGTLSTIREITSKENLNEGSNILILEIHYTDLSKLITSTINSKIEFTVSNGKINPYSVDLVGVEKHEIKRINQS